MGFANDTNFNYKKGEGFNLEIEALSKEDFKDGISFITKSRNFNTYARRVDRLARKLIKSDRIIKLLGEDVEKSKKINIGKRQTDGVLFENENEQNAVASVIRILFGKTIELKYLTYFFMRWLYDLGKTLGDMSLDNNQKQVLISFRLCIIDKNGNVTNSGIKAELKRYLKLCYSDMQEYIVSIIARRDMRKSRKNEKQVEENRVYNKKIEMKIKSNQENLARIQEKFGEYINKGYDYKLASFMNENEKKKFKEIKEVDIQNQFWPILNGMICKAQKCYEIRKKDFEEYDAARKPVKEDIEKKIEELESIESVKSDSKFEEVIKNARRVFSDDESNLRNVLGMKLEEDLNEFKMFVGKFDCVSLYPKLDRFVYCVNRSQEEINMYADRKNSIVNGTQPDIKAFLEYYNGVKLIKEVSEDIKNALLKINKITEDEKFLKKEKEFNSKMAELSEYYKENISYIDEVDQMSWGNDRKELSVVGSRYLNPKRKALVSEQEYLLASKGQGISDKWVENIGELIKGIETKDYAKDIEEKMLKLNKIESKIKAKVEKKKESVQQNQSDNYKNNKTEKMDDKKTENNTKTNNKNMNNVEDKNNSSNKVADQNNSEGNNKEPKNNAKENTKFEKVSDDELWQEISKNKQGEVPKNFESNRCVERFKITMDKLRTKLEKEKNVNKRKAMQQLLINMLENL